MPHSATRDRESAAGAQTSSRAREVGYSRQPYHHVAVSPENGTRRSISWSCRRPASSFSTFGSRSGMDAKIHRVNATARSKADWIT